MPPLCTVGFGLGSGLNLEIMGGASLLFLTNLVAIVASAFLVFLLVGLNTEEVQKVMAASRKDEPLARLLSHGPVTRMLATGGQLRWRVVMILILLASIAVPLGRALSQVARETRARGAVQDELKRMVPANALVSQQVSVGKDEIVIHLFSTVRIPDAKVAEARLNLMRRTGHDVQLSVDAVASKRELADLMERLVQPAHAVVAKEKSVAEIQKELLDKVSPAVTAIWPSSDAPIQDFNVIVGTSGITIAVRYQASKDLDQVPIDMVQQSLRSKLGLLDLIVRTERVRPARAPGQALDASDKRKRP
jgi:hypothetical protein